MTSLFAENKERTQGFIKKLRKDFPTLIPVRCYYRPMPGDALAYGWSELSSKKAELKSLHYNLVVFDDGHTDWGYIRLVAIHEYAHCLAWVRDEEDKDHSEEWARQYSRLYRFYVEG